MASKSDGPDLIPGIYHYCDRWCRRCPFTSRCLQFRLETEKPESRTSLEGLEVFGVPFWNQLATGLREASRIIGDAVAAGKDAGASAEPLPEQVLPASRRSARDHPLSRAALAYAGMADRWFAEAETARRSLSSPEAVEVIRHYRYLVYPKTVRAIDGRIHAVSPDDPESRRDSLGSAKIALIMIDRSIGAWSILYAEHPGAEDRTLELLLHLDRLRRSLEIVFPEARAFRRPGFDTEPPSV